LWGVYFAARNPAQLLADSPAPTAAQATDYLRQPGVLFSLGKLFCAQLEGSALDTAFSNQVFYLRFLWGF
jgi:hypothetical protein